MSSARLPLAIAVLGLAACAHTPSNPTFVLPDVRHAAPVIVKSVDEVPDGFDEHVVVSIDRDALQHAREQAVLGTARSGHYYYGHRRSTASLPSVATQPHQSSATRPAAAVNTGTAPRQAPRRNSSEARRARH